MDASGRSWGGLADRVPAPAVFLTSGLTQYVGAALAVGLFAVLPAASVAWWRIAVSAVVLLAWRRPWRQAWTRSDLLGAAAFGVVLATMNVSFYIAIEHLPLGTAVAIEFLGPVAVAGITGRGWRDRVGIALAAAGVVLLAGVQLDQAFTRDTVIGLVAITGSAVSWAGYILLGRRVAVRRDGIASLAVGMAAGTVVWAPLAIGTVAPVVTDPARAAAIVGVAVLSSVIPYVLEQLVLRRVTAARFAILLAMLPVTAALIGALFLGQIPTVLELAGMALVCVAIVLSGPRPAGPDEPENPLPA
ncbi:EamA family transporter [Nakamurella sp.]|uniref:EamA family transporter n=1 Tax=Nakamurella sp. TaxID=1869182 RepID=UPI003B3BC115